MKITKASNEFCVGKHGLGYMSDSFKKLITDEEITPEPCTITTLTRDMTEAEIEKEITKGRHCVVCACRGGARVVVDYFLLDFRRNADDPSALLASTSDAQDLKSGTLPSELVINGVKYRRV